ncbi:hypothetical protein WT77_18920 [Burkholderia stagnalis]|nr:hypothetical protein WT77_18920 [Burkholderia stagnalis]
MLFHASLCRRVGAISHHPVQRLEFTSEQLETMACFVGRKLRFIEVALSLNLLCGQLTHEPKLFGVC